ncbi:MAG: aminoacyl-histidine dipeptidase [Candidatus Accumulibacter sp.]|jgi:dipeptidase D|nr:aminoacyl-histidine dipeptidase [Accumulibacter sp.]
MNPILPKVFHGLRPAIVWKHFATLCAIPRPSKGEARLREHLRAWAVARGLTAVVDAAGNLIVRKNASAGSESAPGVVLQAHLDMVCQANADTPHDFARDALEPVLRDGCLLAEHTTLGADNGIGVALILAALEDDRLTRGPIEALFTVDEESGMSGARGLDPDALEGRRLLNLDTEEWGRFYLGCAGGIDVNARRAGQPELPPDAHAALRIDVRGLVGGHSGVNIHEGRGHAIKLLTRALRAIERRWPLRLASLRGGSARNALPREASAMLAVPREAVSGVAGLLAGLQAVFREELAGIDEGVTLCCTPGEVSRVMGSAEQAAWLAALHAAPQGIRRMSLRAPGVVETSDNLGIVDLAPEGGECHFLVRSLIDSAGAALAEEIVSLFTLSGAVAEISGHYPGWAPNPASPLLGVCREVHRRLFGGPPSVDVIHAGLECGIIRGKYPEMDMLSFGPTIHGAHAPGESVEVRSVEHCWRLLREMLAALAEQKA